MPAAQREVALARAQRRPHAPQWLSVVSTSVSQPVSAVQSPRPFMHAVCWHAPATQRAKAPGTAPSHATPHAPQLASSRDTSTQAPPQSLCPGGHAHAPATQLCPGTHAVVHDPQCALSVAVFTQPDASQKVCPARAHAQRPLAQVWPAGHATPHALQFEASRVRSTQPDASQ